MKIESFSEAKRFKLLREELNYTQQAFASLLEIGATTADIERARTKISGSIVVHLMEKFHINPLWLFGKSEQKYINQPKDFSPKVITLASEGDENIVLVNQKASAGYPHNIQDVEWYQSLPRFKMPLPEYRNATYRGFQVEGDSMVPNIHPNDWVLGKSIPGIGEALNNRIHVFVLKDSVLVKKLHKLSDTQNLVRLISLNPDYPPMDILIDDIQELWLVNSKLSFNIEDSADSLLLRQLQESMDELKIQISNLKKE